MSKLYTKKYFAYGANTNNENMKYRCPLAINLGKLILPDYRLVFRGVADIEPYAGSSVQGVLWEITEDCEKSLDVYEGYPHLYRKESFPCTWNHDQSTVFDVMYYKMNSYHLGKPTTGYYSTIYQGFIDNKLDIKYLNQAVKIS